MGSIYKITNTLNGMAYIGKTVYDAEKTRKRDHYNGHGNKPLKDDIDKYGKDAFTFEILHDSIIPEFLDTLERQEIAKYNCVKPYGYNQNRGGSGVISHSEKTCQKISEALKGENNPMKRPEVSRKSAEAQKGRKVSEETKQKISRANKGRKHSEEAKQKISKAHTGTPRSEEHRRNISEAQKGTPCSEETKQKISRANKGKPSWNKGKTLSEEYRRNLSEAKLGMSQEAFTILVSWLLRDGWSKSKIARELQKSHPTIRKYAPRVSK